MNNFSILFWWNIKVYLLLRHNWCTPCIKYFLSILFSFYTIQQLYRQWNSDLILVKWLKSECILFFDWVETRRSPVWIRFNRRVMTAFQFQFISVNHWSFSFAPEIYLYIYINMYLDWGWKFQDCYHYFGLYSVHNFLIELTWS